MKNTIFKGIATAMVTPMTPHGVDYDGLARLIDFQIDHGTDAIVVCGSTGEAATMTEQEHLDVCKFCIDWHLTKYFHAEFCCNFINVAFTKYFDFFSAIWAF